MAGFLTNDEIAGLTGQMWTHFLTFSTNHNLIVHKEPLKVLNSNTYVPVSGVYPVMTVNKHPKELQLAATALPAGQVKIKVAEDCRNFINNGKNQFFELDGLKYNLAEDETVQNYLGLKFYYFILKRTA